MVAQQNLFRKVWNIMVRNKTLTIAAAALTGLLAGSNARAMGASSPASGSSITHSTAGQKAISLDGDKHACKGQNSCKEIGRAHV